MHVDLEPIPRSGKMQMTVQMTRAHGQVTRARRSNLIPKNLEGVPIGRNEPKPGEMKAQFGRPEVCIE